MPRWTRRRRDRGQRSPRDEKRPPSHNALAACRGKRRFGTEREVDDAVYYARMEGRNLAYYLCDICGGWHLTSRAPGD